MRLVVAEWGSLVITHTFSIKPNSFSRTPPTHTHTQVSFTLPSSLLVTFALNPGRVGCPLLHHAPFTDEPATLVPIILHTGPSSISVFKCSDVLESLWHTVAVPYRFNPRTGTNLLLSSSFFYLLQGVCKTKIKQISLKYHKH